jgi:predicted phosphodiesterase
MLAAEGITEVVHAGDLTAGMNVYAGQYNDLKAHGFDDQLQYCIDNYPKQKGISTYFIDGNHDESFKKQAGISFGERLAEKRKDLVYLGLFAGDIELNGVKIKLQHGGGGASYAKSYKIQKYAENIGGGMKPQVYVLGHYHTSLYMSYRNMHCLLPGCWQRPNDFSIRLGLPNTVGGWIITLDVADDEHNSIDCFGCRFVQYY